MKVARTVLVVSAMCLPVIAIAAHFVHFGYEQCHPVRTVVTPAQRERARQNLPGLTEVSFEPRDGVLLRGWFVPPRRGSVVVLAHGLLANRASFLPESEVLARHGYGLLAFDQRAHGESGGTVATWGDREASDVGQAVRFVRAQPGVSRVALLGFSVGGSAVARAAANDPTIAAVVLCATWTSLPEEIAYKTSHRGPLAAWLASVGFRISGVSTSAVQPLADLARIAPRPLLFVSGDEDTDTPPWVMARMFSTAAEPKAWWREPTTAHGGYFQANPSEYERRVVGFLDRVLGGGLQE